MLAAGITRSLKVVAAEAAAPSRGPPPLVEDSRQHVGRDEAETGVSSAPTAGMRSPEGREGSPAEVGIDRRPRRGNRAVVGEGARGGHGECYPPSDRWRFSTGVLKLCSRKTRSTTSLVTNICGRRVGATP